MAPAGLHRIRGAREARHTYSGAGAMVTYPTRDGVVWRASCGGPLAAPGYPLVAYAARSFFSGFFILMTTSRLVTSLK